jgi:hypothetical protein
MAIKKNIIKDALAEAKQIEQFAYESAKKALEESFAPQTEQAVLSTLKEIENSSEEKEENTAPVSEQTEVVENIQETTEELSENDTQKTSDNSVEENTNLTETNSEKEMATEQEEIFEVEGVSTPAPTSADTDAANAAVSEPEPSINDIETKLADMAEKIDSILNAVNPTAGSEGQVDVIDDETAGQTQPTPDVAPAPAPAAAAPAPAAQDDTVVSEDEMMFEIDEEFMNALAEMNKTVSEDTVSELNLSEMNDLDEIEIVAEEDGDSEEEEDDTVEEMRGVGNTVKRSAANRQQFMKDKKHTGVNEGVEKIKAQYESTIDELIKENASLKQAVEEYKANIQEFNDSFVELQKQINEMHVFNGKLAYANRLLSKGGLTNSEKVKIAEAFDKAETVEEAKKVYTQFLNEMKSKSETATQVKDIKTAKPSVAPSTQTAQSQTIFESAESKRMKKLAGIIKEENL